jgi:hypothetical protein
MPELASSPRRPAALAAPHAAQLTFPKKRHLARFHLQPYRLGRFTSHAQKSFTSCPGDGCVCRMRTSLCCCARELHCQVKKHRRREGDMGVGAREEGQRRSDGHRPFRADWLYAPEASVPTRRRLHDWSGGRPADMQHFRTHIVNTSRPNAQRTVGSARWACSGPQVPPGLSLGLAGIRTL